MMDGIVARLGTWSTWAGLASCSVKPVEDGEPTPMATTSAPFRIFRAHHPSVGRGGPEAESQSAFAVEVVDLTRIFGDRLGIRALDGVSLAVRPGEFVAIMGPSGGGKSTLLHLIGALDRPTSGRILVAGRDLATVRDLDAFRARTVGFVFQLHNLIPTLTALENVEIPMYEGPFSEEVRQERARQLLEWVGLADRANHRPGQLSGGERQRVAVARALANQPAVILADEPTGSLDSRSGAEILRLLRDLNETQGTTVVLVTHDPLIALESDRIITLRDGRVQRDQPIAEAYRRDLESFRRSEVGRLIFGETRGVAEGD